MEPIIVTDVCEKGRVGVRSFPNIRDPVPYHLLMLDCVCLRAKEFDILHFQYPTKSRS